MEEYVRAHASALLTNFKPQSLIEARQNFNVEEAVL